MYEISYSKPAERYFKKIKDKQLLSNSINPRDGNPRRKPGGSGTPPPLPCP